MIWDSSTDAARVGTVSPLISTMASCCCVCSVLSAKSGARMRGRERAWTAWTRCPNAPASAATTICTGHPGTPTWMACFAIQFALHESGRISATFVLWLLKISSIYLRPWLLLPSANELDQLLVIATSDRTIYAWNQGCYPVAFSPNIQRCHSPETLGMVVKISKG